ncbi:hypothetical protein ZIOFF_014429 [Zingiber officinale]|uniref:Transmembrane protein n=1 Tax=Zingiber officinale TaxID=94328 RepID=A0A8J5HHD9_ZINOF|nr:hypothetical protein ZIOFF_014429 [Zingiber officinale]
MNEVANSDDSKMRSNGIATGGGSEEGICGTIEFELDPVVAGCCGDTLCSVLRDFFAGVVSPPPLALLSRIKSSVANEHMKTTYQLFSDWKVGAITLLTLTGLLIFLCFLFTATINAIIVSLLVSLAAACGFLAFFFTCLIAIYIGALSMAAFIISITTISAIIIAMDGSDFSGSFGLSPRKVCTSPHDQLARQVPLYLHMQLLGKQDGMPRQNRLVENDN